MLKGFFDASGTLNQVANYVLAGYVSEVEKWEHLSDAWKAALDGPPKLEYFKIRESVLRINQFDGWSDRCAQARARKFRRLVTRYVLGGTAIVLPTDLYIRHVRGKVPKEMDDPYYICFLACIELTAKLMAFLLVDEPIDFVFDTENLDTRARALLELFKRWPWPQSKLVGELDFRDDKNVLALQTADMIAWLLRTELDNPEAYFSGEQMFLTVNGKDPVIPPVLVNRFTEAKITRYMDKFHENLRALDPSGELSERWQKRGKDEVMEP